MQEPPKGRVHWSALVLSSIFFLCAGAALGLYVLPSLFNGARSANAPLAATQTPAAETNAPLSPAPAQPGEATAPPSPAQPSQPQSPLASARLSCVSVTAQFGKSRRVGSGVIIRQDGKILSSAQLVDKAAGVTVTLDGQAQSLPAKVVASDAVSGLALLSVERQGLPAAVFAPASEVQLGQTVYAIGTPSAAYPNTLTRGVVGGLNRQVELDGQLQTFLQTDAAVTDGFIGGGLFNEQGQCIGLIRYREHQDGYDAQGNPQAAQGIALALPSDTVKSLMDTMLQGKAVERPTLQLTAVTISAEKAAALGLSGGVHVQQVQQGGAVHLAGLQAGDVITAIGGASVSSLEQLQSMVSLFQVNEDVIVDVRRGNETLQLAVRIANEGGPAATASPSATPKPSASPSPSAAPKPSASPSPSAAPTPEATVVRDARLAQPLLSLLRGCLLWM